MSTRQTANIGLKKTSPLLDWHPADIVAAVHKRGSSLERIGRQHKYSRSVLTMTLHRPWPKGERIIASFLGVQPEHLWPSRYRPDGTPKSARGERGIGRTTSKNITGGGAVNV